MGLSIKLGYLGFKYQKQGEVEMLTFLRMPIFRRVGTAYNLLGVKVNSDDCDKDL